MFAACVTATSLRPSSTTVSSPYRSGADACSAASRWPALARSPRTWSDRIPSNAFVPAMVRSAASRLVDQPRPAIHFIPCQRPIRLALAHGQHGCCRSHSPTAYSLITQPFIRLRSRSLTGILNSSGGSNVKGTSLPALLPACPQWCRAGRPTEREPCSWMGHPAAPMLADKSTASSSGQTNNACSEKE